jgi:uncharacterized RDD family membrane protein YckC
MDTQKLRRRISVRAIVPFIVAALAGVVLIGYFVWLCAEMAGAAGPSGGSVAAIFSSAAIGLIAGGVGITLGRRQRDH